MKEATATRTIALIAAIAENGVIGKGDTIPWKLPDDMDFFKRATLGSTVVMGRKTWKSIPAKFRPLPERRNVVLTSQPNYVAPGAVVIHSIEEVSAIVDQRQDIVFMGGAEVYSSALPTADTLYITRVHAELEGDVYFPQFNEDEWTLVDEVFHPSDERHEHAFTFRTFKRK